MAKIKAKGKAPFIDIDMSIYCAIIANNKIGDTESNI